jgi:predicted transcriptional regulator of viral defense system
MKFDQLLKLLDGEPIFTTSLLLAGDIPVSSLRMQLSRWVSSGRLIQLRKGVYAIASPYRAKEPHPFLIANNLKKASYVSLQSALEYYGIIPEYVPVVTSITTGRPEVIDSLLGKYQYRHIKKELFWGYRETEVIKDTRVFIAEPEKALLDLIYLSPQTDNKEYIKELRLQNTEKIDNDIIKRYAEKSSINKLRRAADIIISVVGS